MTNGRIDLRYWLHIAVAVCLGILMILGVVIAITLTLMIMRYLNAKPG